MVDLGEEPYVGMCITANHHGAKKPVGRQEGGDPTTLAQVAFRDLTIE
jgi:hypothetical protein